MAPPLLWQVQTSHQQIVKSNKCSIKLPKNENIQFTITTDDCVVWFFEYLEEPKFTYFKNQRTVSSGSLKKEAESKNESWFWLFQKP